MPRVKHTTRAPIFGRSAAQELVEIARLRRRMLLSFQALVRTHGLDADELLRELAGST